MNNGFHRKPGKTAYENCLMPLLKALKWRGSMTNIKEAMPHFAGMRGVDSFCTVLENLSYDSSRVEVKIEGLDKRLLPALLVTSGNDVLVLLAFEKNAFKVFDGITNQERFLSEGQLAQIASKASLYVFRKKKVEAQKLREKGWFWITLRENKGLLYSAIFLSCILNLLMLTTPIFVMVVYDRVIGASSYSMLVEFSVGIVLALIGLTFIYRIRSEHLALLGARFDKMIGDRIMSQLLYLAPSFTETATAGAQVARIKDFDRVREFLSGPLLSVFFEVPFILLSLGLVWYLGGVLALIPVLMIILFLILSFSVSTKINKWIKESARSAADLQEFLLETIESIRVIKYLGLIPQWSQRHREKSAKSNLIVTRLTLLDGISSSLSEVIMTFSGMLIMVIGAVLAMGGKLEVGVMLALMMVVWRVLAPIRSLMDSLPRMLRLYSSIQQINRLMDLPPEIEQMARVKHGKVNFIGDVSFLRVSMRYPASYAPSLIGVSFSIKAGTLVGIAGRNGSGKSTLLKVLLGLYPCQAGNVLIDGRDIRQLNPIDLRASIGYLPQNPELFFGTIESNLRLGDAVVMDEAMRKATQEAGILEAILNLPEGFKTKIHDQSTQRLPASFAQSLCLARAYLRDTNILFLDEPGNALDMVADHHLLKYLESVRGKKTVFIVTHRPSHLNKMDRILMMDQGQLVMEGAPAEILEKIPFDCF